MYSSLNRRHRREYFNVPTNSDAYTRIVIKNSDRKRRSRKLPKKTSNKTSYDFSTTPKSPSSRIVAATSQENSTDPWLSSRSNDLSISNNLINWFYSFKHRTNIQFFTLSLCAPFFFMRCTFCVCTYSEYIRLQIEKCLKSQIEQEKDVLKRRKKKKFLYIFVAYNVAILMKRLFKPTYYIPCTLGKTEKEKEKKKQTKNKNPTRIN